jgi:drug/metabolite transporter (DMT)-like permease
VVPANYMLLLAVSLAWASEYLFIRWADVALPPLTVAAAMAGIAALALLLVVGAVLRRPLLPVLRRPLVPLVLGASSVALPNLSVAYAEKSIGPDVVALTGTVVPILTLLVAVFVTHQHRSRPLNLFGILVALGGLAVFVGLDEVAGTTLDGILIQAGGGVAFVFSGLYASAKAASLDKGVLTAWIMTFGAAMLALPAVLLEPGIPRLSLATLASLAAAGLVSMAFAYLCYFALIARAGAPFAALYAFLVPPLGVLLGVVFLGEALTLRHLGGLALVLIGLWMITRPDARVNASAVGTQTPG